MSTQSKFSGGFRRVTGEKGLADDNEPAGEAGRFELGRDLVRRGAAGPQDPHYCILPLPCLHSPARCWWDFASATELGKQLVVVVRGGSDEFCNLKSVNVKVVKSAAVYLYFLTQKDQMIFGSEDEVTTFITEATARTAT